MGNPGEWIFGLIHAAGGINTFGAEYVWTLFFGTVAVGIWRMWAEGRVFRDVGNLTQALDQARDKEPRMQLQGWFADHPESVLKPLWDQYRQALQIHDASGEAAVVDPLRYFSEYAILYNIAHRRITEIIPTLLTMAGILGTFLGLVAGLHGLNINSSSNLSSGIAQLVGGLSLKFTSSVFGILLALLWIIADKMIWSPRLEKAVVDLLDRLEKLFEVPPEELLLHQLTLLQQAQRDDLATLVTDALIPQLVGGFQDALYKTLVPEIQHLGVKEEETVARLNALGEELTRVAENTTQAQMTGLEQIAHTFIDQVSMQTVDLTRSLHEAFAQTVDVQHEILDIARQAFQEAQRSMEQAEKVNQVQRDLWNESAAIHRELLDSAGYWSQFVESMKEVTQGLPTRLENFFSQLETQSRVFVERFQSIEEAMLRDFHSVVTEMKDVMEVIESEKMMLAAAQEHFQHEQLRFADQMSLAIDRFPTVVEELKTAVRDIEEQATQALTQWATALSHYGESMSQALSNHMEAFHELETSMAEKMLQLTATFATTAQAFQNYVEKTMDTLQENLSTGIHYTFSQFDDELAQAVDYLANGVKVIESGVKTLAIPVQQVDEAARILFQHMNTFSQAMSRMQYRETQDEVNRS
ncbi:hypothetical protein SAMN00768000_2488 [Sulfobacillus thermosulfidooxidans DSM 9293]|uniref:Uncharacterized protein n=1 Tax=Sulfobacillus thermosulfidooxidans (strain DSM 9293 / VKM B-1269 / AT-1) TaxID=929705 RepID=A0A1W1WHQ9_SULTA|nr:MotA/TolQ/ExbB proton channel family protein [Sulfobacillus thermosulfidooxidans]SMC05848.1 hypothetical protein SAMN00768000_2488 [Sulfobacillus thermosulfidooxidans DSM 9293]